MNDWFFLGITLFYQKSIYGKILIMITEQEKQHQAEIEALIQIAFDKGIAAAIKAAKTKNDPHILDDFHDALIDRFYQKLVEAGKLK